MDCRLKWSADALPVAARYPLETLELGIDPANARFCWFSTAHTQRLYAELTQAIMKSRSLTALNVILMPEAYRSLLCKALERDQHSALRIFRFYCVAEPHPATSQALTTVMPGSNDWELTLAHAYLGDTECGLLSGWLLNNRSDLALHLSEVCHVSRSEQPALLKCIWSARGSRRSHSISDKCDRALGTCRKSHIPGL